MLAKHGFFMNYDFVSHAQSTSNNLFVKWREPVRQMTWICSSHDVKLFVTSCESVRLMTWNCTYVKWRESGREIIWICSPMTWICSSHDVLDQAIAKHTNNAGCLIRQADSPVWNAWCFSELKCLVLEICRQSESPVSTSWCLKEYAGRFLLLEKLTFLL